MVRQIITLFIFSVTIISCSTVKTLHPDVVYHYANGFVTDRNNDIAFYYANGFVTKHIDSSSEHPVKINDDLEIYRLARNCFLYTAWADMGRWGRVGSNGLVVVSDGKALLVDSPVTESQTVELAWWFDKNLDVKFESFVPGHWHDDCVGGMAWLNRNGVKTYANKETNRILAEKGSVQAQMSFSDSLALSVGTVKAEIFYLGGGHTVDNVVVWIPSEKILFGGCMMKDIHTESIGNISDSAPLEEWFDTIGRVEERFADVNFVIPGHGKAGGAALFKHTKEIVQNELLKKPNTLK